jgi:hypothetical protein
VERFLVENGDNPAVGLLQHRHPTVR